MHLVPDWIIQDAEPNTALYARMDETSAIRQTVLLEGEELNRLQRGAYMGRAAEAVKSLNEDAGRNGPNRHMHDRN